MHNKHHATPQKINHDIDLDTIPLVAFFNTAVESSNRTRSISKLWLKFQAWTFLPITSGVFVMAFWMYFLHPRKVVKDLDIVQALLMLSAHILRPSVFYYLGGYSMLQSYGLFFLSQVISGIYLFGHFSTSHTFTDVVHEKDNPNWVRFAFEHTVDINPDNPIINWVMGYLNCQVVHHLFPNMPQFRQPEVSRMLRDWSSKHGIKYTIVSYYEAWRLTFQNLHDVGDHYYNLNDVKKRE